MRAGGFGIPAFYSKVGSGTDLQKGGVPTKMSSNGTPEKVSNPLESKSIMNKNYLLHHSLNPDYSIIRAWKADAKGNCLFRKCSLNYNVDAGMAGKICIVEAEEIVEAGLLDGDDIQLSGVFVHRVVKAPNVSFPQMDCKGYDHLLGEGAIKAKREMILKRAANEIKDGMYVHLARGLPRLARKFVPKENEVDYFSENGILGTGEGNCCLDGSHQFSSIIKGGAVAKASDAYALLRSGKLDLIIAEAKQVSENGDLANLANDSSIYSTHDLTASGTPIIVIMDMLNAEGKSNLVKKCTERVSGSKCITKLITDMGVFCMKGPKPKLVEIANGVAVADVKKACGCDIEIYEYLRQMK
jgi:3-oxoacid CoA-transferase